jgi:hypothetical protein
MERNIVEDVGNPNKIDNCLRYGLKLRHLERRRENQKRMGIEA